MCKVIVLVAESSSGKDTIYNEIINSNPRIRECVSHTTRPPREGELDGVAYNFIEEHEFMMKLISEEFIETRYYNTEHGTWKYGLSKNAIDINSDNIYLVILDLEGLKQLTDYLGRENVFSIYLEVLPHIRYIRSLERQSNEINSKYKKLNFAVPQEILRRFKDDALKFREAREVCNLTLPNNTFGEREYVVKFINNFINLEVSLNGSNA